MARMLDWWPRMKKNLRKRLSVIFWHCCWFHSLVSTFRWLIAKCWLNWVHEPSIISMTCRRYGNLASEFSRQPFKSEMFTLYAVKQWQWWLIGAAELQGRDDPNNVVHLIWVRKMLCSALNHRFWWCDNFGWNSFGGFSRDYELEWFGWVGFANCKLVDYVVYR